MDEARAGDGDALSRAWTILYNQLRVVAHNIIKNEQFQHQMDATELVGEIWMRGSYDTNLAVDREQFFGRVFRHMSQELIDRARKRNTAKRGGNWSRRPLDAVSGELSSINRHDVNQQDAAAMLMAAWQNPEEQHSLDADVAFFRLVLGMTNEETAMALDRTHKQAEQQWCSARAKLRDALEPPSDPA